MHAIYTIVGATRACHVKIYSKNLLDFSPICWKVVCGNWPWSWAIERNTQGQKVFLHGTHENGAVSVNKEDDRVTI